jgi:hypothetical protein
MPVRMLAGQHVKDPQTVGRTALRNVRFRLRIQPVIATH